MRKRLLLQMNPHRRLSQYTWETSCDVVADVSDLGFPSATVWAQVLGESLKSPTFENALSVTLTVPVDVDPVSVTTVIATRNPSPLPSIQPSTAPTTVPSLRPTPRPSLHPSTAPRQDGSASNRTMIAMGVFLVVTLAVGIGAVVATYVKNKGKVNIIKETINTAQSQRVATMATASPLTASKPDQSAAALKPHKIVLGERGSVELMPVEALHPVRLPRGAKQNDNGNSGSNTATLNGTRRVEFGNADSKYDSDDEFADLDGLDLGSSSEEEDTPPGNYEASLSDTTLQDTVGAMGLYVVLSDLGLQGDLPAFFEEMGVGRLEDLLHLSDATLRSAGLTASAVSELRNHPLVALASSYSPISQSLYSQERKSRSLYSRKSKSSTVSPTSAPRTPSRLAARVATQKAAHLSRQQPEAPLTNSNADLSLGDESTAASPAPEAEHFPRRPELNSPSKLAVRAPPRARFVSYDDLVRDAEFRASIEVKRQVPYGVLFGNNDVTLEGLAEAERQRAATKLQALVRGRAARLNILKRRPTAIVTYDDLVLKAQRDLEESQKLAAEKLQMLKERRAAAVKIQARHRGRMSRLKSPLPPKPKKVSYEHMVREASKRAGLVRINAFLASSRFDRHDELTARFDSLNISSPGALVWFC